MCWGQERCGNAGDRRGDSTVGTLGMRKLMRTAGDKSIDVVMGMLWTGWVVWRPGTREVMGWPLPRCKVLGPWAQGRSCHQSHPCIKSIGSGPQGG